MSFNSVQQARSFLNQEADAYIRHLLSLGQTLDNKTFAWFMNNGLWEKSIFQAGANPKDPYLVQALEDLEQRGYIEIYAAQNQIGTIKITPLGYQNHGNW